MIKAVLFDLDGTITDTEIYYQKAWPEAIRHFGYHAEPWMPLALRSLGRPFAQETLLEWFGADFPYDEVRILLDRTVQETTAKNGVPLKPGARELLDDLRRRGITSAITTSNDYEHAKKKLDQAGITECFDRIICGNMIALGKPEPDTYLFACRQLQLRPDETFAVEDSPNGVKSAYRAGCKVIMVPDMTPPDDEVKPMLYACVETLADIRGLLDMQMVYQSKSG